MFLTITALYKFTYLLTYLLTAGLDYKTGVPSVAELTASECHTK